MAASIKRIQVPDPVTPSASGHIRHLIFVVLLFLCFLFLAGTSFASEGPERFAKACALFRMPPSLIMAIARTESDCNPLCITINGREYRPKTKEEALMLAKKALGQKKSVDIGLMQINSCWLKELNLSCETVLEPKNNLLLGLWILRQEMRRYGRTWKAVGAYHSKKPARQRAYIRRVQKNWLLARQGMQETGRL